jgi:hypothetical protein
MELMLSVGYETAHMQSGGTLVTPTYQTIVPTLGVDGTNGFRLGLEVSFTLGDSYHPVDWYRYRYTNFLQYKRLIL